ncbi:MAG: ABC transporter permease [Deltaproteobacteria bacterium]|nr:ABC transporter permease [Deltaproteobacteria bacterium]MBI3387259.1 ABC transporter permease [Deltaproteobacteria bacterium]
MLLLQRLGWAVVILFGVSALTFALSFLVPSDPARTVAGPKADRETLELIRHEMGLDAPVPVQFGRYLARLVRGDLGRSYVTRENVRDAIIERLPATLFLALSSLALAIVVGIASGTLTSLRVGSGVDIGVLVLSLVILSVPVFWLGILLLDVIGYRLRWLPLGGFGGLRFVLLPASALALRYAAYYGRIVHTNMRQVVNEDYVRSARAKGLGPVAVYGRHALRNALIPVTTLVGLDFAGLMGGVVLTETVFNWPGLGRLAVDAVFNLDIPMIMGTVQFSALLVVVANMLIDLLYLVIDPRIRLSS